MARLNVSIRLRLALAVAVIAAVLTAAGGVIFAYSLGAGMRATLQHTLRRTALGVQGEVSAGELRLSAGPRPAPASGDQVVQVLAPRGQVMYTTTAAGPSSLLSAHALAAARHGQYFVTESRPGWPARRMLLAQPLPGGTGGNRLLVVGSSLDVPDDAMARVKDDLLIAGPLVIAVAAAGGWLLAGRALRPVERMRAQAAAISAHSIGRRLARPPTRDELSRLSDTFNSLLDQLHSALVRQQQFVAAAGHELRTPLAVLRAEVDLARRPDQQEAEVRAALDVLHGRLRQLSRLSDDLLLLARGDEGMLALQMKAQPLEPLTTRSLLLFRARAAQQGVALVLDARPGVAAAVDADRYQQIVDNLVVNALDHAAGTGLVEVTLRDDNGGAAVAVADRGPGLPDDFLPVAFERFTRPAPGRSQPRSGSGLGLAIVALLAAAQGGTAEIGNRDGGGAIVTVRFPAPSLGQARPAPI